MGITTVVSAAYDTSGNGGRRLVRLSNGWLVSTAYNSAGGIHYFYKSTDNGQTWSQLCYLEETSLTADFVSQIAICSYGTTVYLIATMDSNGAKIYFQKFDAATQINTNISTGKITIDSQHNTLYGLSLAVSSDGSTLWGAWSSNNSRYSLSKNGLTPQN
ncbi:hypothetical protein [Brevibacillus panacihumi]|uniref:hypothetical protein n=1 Tax=Brevibacillus panacihumi TaxID=497735 RepID=UPI0011CD8499|nr:hypothetical protein [Brevibacillus panacihumi]